MQISGLIYLLGKKHFAGSISEHRLSLRKNSIFQQAAGAGAKVFRQI
jgi:hypothetical protein